MSSLSAPRSVSIVVNPKAGRGAAGKAIRRVNQALSAHFDQVTVLCTTCHGDGERLAAEEIAKGVTLIASMGGDGTLHEVTNAILKAGNDSITIGLIPFGTGNDFARGVGLNGSLESVVDALVSGISHPIDIGLIDGVGLGGTRYFLVAAGVGFVADTAKTVNDGVRYLTGAPAYVYGAVKTLRAFEHLELSLKVDDNEPITTDAMLISVSNVATTGGGIKIAPDALPDDGMLDICIVKKISKSELLRKLPSAFVGRHINDPSVTMIRATSLEIKTFRPVSLWIDGEVVGQTPARFSILPGKLNMMLPRTYNKL